MLLAMACRADSGSAALRVSPTPSEEALGEARVRAILEADCDLIEIGAAVTVTYSAVGEGGRRVSRLRLYVDGVLEDDTGPLDVAEIERVRRLTTRAGRQVSLRIVADSMGLPSTVARSAVRCPAVTPGPRA